MPKDDPLITPTTDLFIASLWSAPKNEPLLLSLINAVMTNIGHPKIVEAKVLNPFNIVRLMYSRQDQWREDALLIMFGNKPWSFDRPLYLRSKLMKRITSLAKELPGQRRTQMRLLNRGSPSR